MGLLQEQQVLSSVSHFSSLQEFFQRQGLEQATLKHSMSSILSGQSREHEGEEKKQGAFSDLPMPSPLNLFSNLGMLCLS